MRLLMTTDAVGGVWTFTQELAAGLLARGCAVALVCVGRAPSAAQMVWVGQMRVRFGDGFAFAQIEAPLEWQQNNESAFNGGADQLLRVAAEFGAELIHSSQYCFGALSPSLPVVVTAHSDVLSWAASCLADPIEDSAWLRQYKRLVGEGLRHACAVVAPTKWMLQALAEGFTLPRQQAVIANGRELPEESGAGVRKLQAITAGRVWDEAKNTAMLAKVLSPMPILVAGEFDGQAKAQICLGAATLLGPLAQQDLLALMRGSSAYVCTSRYEPFGLAPLEAALCGCAVLVNDIPPLREVWGNAALYFQDAAALSMLLQRLAAEDLLLQEVQERCALHAQRYTRDAMTMEYLALYQHVVSARESCRAA